MKSHQQSEEEILAEPPEEFLDPIMLTLMADPVILPSSRATVDRSTIARYLPYLNGGTEYIQFDSEQKCFNTLLQNIHK